MRKYCLVAEKRKDTFGNIHYEVRVCDYVPDNSRGARWLEVLKTFEAKSYSDAVKMFNFSVENMGRYAYCGVDISGEPFHGGGEA